MIYKVYRYTNLNASKAWLGIVWGSRIMCSPLVHVYISTFMYYRSRAAMALLALLQECPEGVVHEDSFKDIYAKFFPHGSEYEIFYIYIYIHNIMDCLFG